MRNRYLDLLRAAAIVRVIVYHLYTWPWLSIALPAMGVMFALAGSLTAASLDRRAAGQVVTSRLRRLLPPLWVLGLIAVPVMLAAGWAHDEDTDHPFSPVRLVFWLLPIGDPPGSEAGIDAWEPLWYIRAYLWFVLLSPLLYLAYRKAGWFVVAAPIAGIYLLDRTGFELPDVADTVMWDFVTYGACWIAGFAHHDGRLARLRPSTVLGAAFVLGATALYYQSGHQGEEPWDLNDVSESQALWSLAWVLIALRWQPDMSWLARNRILDRTVNLLNNRAVTVYLWHNIAIAAIWPVLTVLALDDLPQGEGVVSLLATLALTACAVLAFGWAEDLAAKRRPRLWPTGGATPGPGPTSTTAATEPVGPVPAGWPEVSRDGEPVPDAPGSPTGGAPTAGAPAAGAGGAGGAAGLRARHGRADSGDEPEFPVHLPVAGRPIPGYAPEVAGGARPAESLPPAHEVAPGHGPAPHGYEELTPAHSTAPHGYEEIKPAHGTAPHGHDRPASPAGENEPGHIGVPWAGHSGSAPRRDAWQVSPQQGASDPDTPAPIALHHRDDLP